MLLNELFKSDGTDFHFEVVDKEVGSHWIGKSNLDDGRTITVNAFENRGMYDLSFDVDGSMGFTNAGDEIEIFKRVIFMLKEFAKEFKPEGVEMSSTGASRTSLYRRMFKRALPGWRMVTIINPAAPKTASMGLTPGGPFPMNGVGRFTIGLLDFSPDGRRGTRTLDEIEPDWFIDGDLEPEKKIYKEKFST